MKQTMEEKRIQEFEDAPDDSWWHCPSPTCRCPFRKAECEESGVCPYCQGQAYQSQPWESAMLNDPHLPDVPQSGQAFGQIIT